jgi:hypothetical protein
MKTGIGVKNAPFTNIEASGIEQNTTEIEFPQKKSEQRPKTKLFGYDDSRSSYQTQNFDRDPKQTMTGFAEPPRRPLSVPWDVSRRCTAGR